MTSYHGIVGAHTHLTAQERFRKFFSVTQHPVILHTIAHRRVRLVRHEASRRRCIAAWVFRWPACPLAPQCPRTAARHAAKAGGHVDQRCDARCHKARAGGSVDQRRGARRHACSVCTRGVAPRAGGAAACVAGTRHSCDGEEMCLQCARLCGALRQRSKAARCIRTGIRALRAPLHQGRAWLIIGSP